ncbi:TatD family hydrolase [Syntrophus aciditrophicus]|uniref:Sec-independent protein translocase protein n=1 Tax=Syntrophus aciditrophicus (strain SB) TaxID=56780 RepID=Q2LST3_SYNAS|nr:TatD family hydrolase [Syntrophus aciditrophicus]ABC77143.1 sec-independent protein translocase protein [Syntrophus aciditrophicus SB]
MMIDSHAHLELPEFDSDRDEVIARAKEAGVDAIVTIGIDLDDCLKAVEIADRYDMVYAAVGIHPHEVKVIDRQTYDRMRDLAARPKVVAYGEIGLDFFRNLSPRDVQIRRFGEQLELAQDLNLPVIIHDREAHRETLEILSSWKGQRRGIIHCFSGDYAMARKCLDLGFYISIPGTVTFTKADTLRDVVRRVPAESLLVETDAPFLTPEPHRGKRNESAYVKYTAMRVAELKEMKFEELAEITSRNASEIFSIKL